MKETTKFLSVILVVCMLSTLIMPTNVAAFQQNLLTDAEMLAKFNGQSWSGTAANIRTHYRNRTDNGLNPIADSYNETTVAATATDVGLWNDHWLWNDTSMADTQKFTTTTTSTTKVFDISRFKPNTLAKSKKVYTLILVAKTTNGNKVSCPHQISAKINGQTPGYVIK